MNSRGKFERRLKIQGHLLLGVQDLWFWSARAKESAVINEKPEPLKQRLCFTGTADAGQLELNN